MSLVATAHQIAVLRPILLLPQVLPSGYEHRPSVLSDDWLLRTFLGVYWVNNSCSIGHQGLAGKILFGGSEASCPCLCILYTCFYILPLPQAVRFKKLGAQSFVFLGGAPVSALGGRRRASVRCHLWTYSAVSRPDGGKVGGKAPHLI